MLIPWGIYHYARLIVVEHAARLALVLACLWPFLVVFAHKPFTEFVATDLLCAAFGLASLSVSQSKRGAFAFGALLALVAAIPYAVSALGRAPVVSPSNPHESFLDHYLGTRWASDSALSRFIGNLHMGIPLSFLSLQFGI